LLDKKTIEEEELRTWFTEHAEPLSLDELEQSILF